MKKQIIPTYLSPFSCLFFLKSGFEGAKRIAITNSIIPKNDLNYWMYTSMFLNNFKAVNYLTIGGKEAFPKVKIYDL